MELCRFPLTDLVCYCLTELSRVFRRHSSTALTVVFMNQSFFCFVLFVKPIDWLNPESVFLCAHMLCVMCWNCCVLKRLWIDSPLDLTQTSGVIGLELVGHFLQSLKFSWITAGIYLCLDLQAIPPGLRAILWFSPLLSESSSVWWQLC